VKELRAGTDGVEVKESRTARKWIRTGGKRRRNDWKWCRSGRRLLVTEDQLMSMQTVRDVGVRGRGAAADGSCAGAGGTDAVVICNSAGEAARWCGSIRCERQRTAK
jgi:hypothetical protein